MKKPNACAKSGMMRVMYSLISNASSDYQDAALVCLLWYLFERASDLTLVRKENVSTDASDVFFMRVIRMKTYEEQGLSIFPTDDFATCPVHAIANHTGSAVCLPLRQPNQCTPHPDSAPRRRFSTTSKHSATSKLPLVQTARRRSAATSIASSTRYVRWRRCYSRPVRASVRRSTTSASACLTS